MEQNDVYDVVYVGNYTKDTIVSPAGVRYVDGGAINYAAHAGASLGCKVAVVTRLAEEDRERVLRPLEELGITCLATITLQSTQVKLEYPTNNVDIRNMYVTASAGSISVQEVQGIRMRAAVIGTSFRGEIELETIRFLRDKCEFLTGDAQGFVRVLEGENIIMRPWGEMREVLQYFDVFKTDIKEAEFLTGTNHKRHAVKMLSEYGPREILLTHQDGLVVYANGEYTEVNFYSKNLCGRSGRGDTCTGAYVAKRLSSPPAVATVWAAALTSLKMEKLGPFKGTIAEVENLVKSRYLNGSTHKKENLN
jgi:sugar/nucleoside kinase (ribokinase family)